MIGDLWLTEPMANDVAATCSVTKATVKKWMKNHKIPAAYYALLDIVNNGNLGRIHKDWIGWNINTRDGDLVTPIVYRARRRGYSSMDVFNMQITYQQVSALKSDKSELRARCEGQKKNIKSLELQCQEMERLIEYLEQRIAILSGHNITALRASERVAPSRPAYRGTPEKPNG